MKEVIKVKILHLPLKAKWYDMQERGEKTEEYREITPYWYQRLYQRKAVYYQIAGPLKREDAEYCCEPDLRYILKGDGFVDTELKPYTHVLFRYGYTQRCFINRIDSITIGRGNPEWGAPTDTGYSFYGTKGNWETPREAFAALIDRISGKGIWERNPWVFAYEFELIK